MTNSRAFQNFQINIRDAELLLGYTRAFSNRRTRAMRRELRESELREKVGEAIGVPKKRWDALDCIESGDLFVVFLPDGHPSKDEFGDHKPLLRSSLVAACAALETYVADLTMPFVGRLITNRKHRKLPPRLKDINLTLGQWIEIEEFRRGGKGIKNRVVTPYINEMSSTAPNKIGKLLAIIDVRDWAKRVDKKRGFENGTTEKELIEITERRNLIVHTADRKGRGRGSLKEKDVDRYLENIKSIVNALESVLGSHKV